MDRRFSVAIGIFTILGASAALLSQGEFRKLVRLDSRTIQVNGEWKLVNTIERTSYVPHKKLQLGYRLFIKQTDRELTADGEKTWENGEIIPPGDRTPIHLKGSVNGERIDATFVEAGAQRETNGNVSWKIEGDGRQLSGTFQSTASNASGRSVATKMP